MRPCQLPSFPFFFNRKLYNILSAKDALVSHDTKQLFSLHLPPYLTKPGKVVTNTIVDTNILLNHLTVTTPHWILIDNWQCSLCLSHQTIRKNSIVLSLFIKFKTTFYAVHNKILLNLFIFQTAKLCYNSQTIDEYLHSA